MIQRASFLEAVDFARSGSLRPDSPMHGDAHWRAVAAQGLTIAEAASLGQDGRTVAAIFGLFHDCRRHNDDYDPEHGDRGGQALHDCAPLYGQLSTRLRDIITLSCLHHDMGQTTDDPLLGLGWDADRSVLMRCGIIPAYRFFSVVDAEDFTPFVEQGISVTDNPPSWDQIWQRAFAH